jgi:hypothetical protein
LTAAGQNKSYPPIAHDWHLGQKKVLRPAMTIR